MDHAITIDDDGEYFGEQGGLIDLDGYESDDGLEEISQEEFNDLVTRAEVSFRTPEPSPPPVPTRNGPLGFCEVNANTCRSHLGEIINISDCVELNEDDFLRVTQIIQDLQTDLLRIRGLRFRRQRCLEGMVSKLRNELMLVLDVDANDARPIYEQGMETFDLADIGRRRHLEVTHLPFPAMSFRTMVRWRGKDTARIESDGPLVCRHLHVRTFDTPMTRHDVNKGKMKAYYRFEELIHRVVNPEEDPASSFILPFTLRSSMSGHQRQPVLRTRLRRYTYVDLFCGAGGAARGAAMAGFTVHAGVDSSGICCDTFQANFPRARVYRMSIQEFLDNLPWLPQIDMLHISPPCQFFSPAHTREGPNDELNESALFVFGECIKRLKPRVVTAEQTAGLLTNHSRHFRALIGMITSQGYNVRWNITHFDEFGLAQKRKRLIVFASGPGIPLPPFPKPTHGRRSVSKQPETVVWDVLSKIPDHATLNDASRMPEKTGPSYDPTRHALPRCITTNGGQNLHWSGTRNHTLRELAVLQGFPFDHQFRGNSKRAVVTQIGNAVPAIPWKPFMKSVFETLKAYDDRMAGSLAENPPVTPVEDDCGETPEKTRTPGASSSSSTDPTGPRRAQQTTIPDAFRRFESARLNQDLAGAISAERRNYGYEVTPPRPSATVLSSAQNDTGSRKRKLTLEVDDMTRRTRRVTLDPPSPRVDDRPRGVRRRVPQTVIDLTREHDVINPSDSDATMN